MPSYQRAVPQLALIVLLLQAACLNRSIYNETLAGSSLEARPAVLEVGSDITSVIDVKVYAGSEPVAGQPVSIHCSPLGLSIVQPGRTDSSGQAIGQARCTNTGVYTMSASISVAGQILMLPQTATLDCMTGSPGNIVATLTASPVRVVADGASEVHLTVTARDSLGAPVGDRSVTFTSTGQDLGFLPASGVTEDNGQFLASVTSTRAQNLVINALVGNVSASATVEFDPGPVSIIESTIAAVPSTNVLADGNHASAITVFIADAFTNPISSAMVTLATSGADTVIDPTSGPTDANGFFFAAVTSTVAQTETVTASMLGVLESVSLTFAADAVSASNSTLVVNPNSLIADGSSEGLITVEARDNFNNPVANATVSLSTNIPTASISPISGTTSATGLFYADITGVHPASGQITALLEGGVNATASVTFIAGPPDTGMSSVTATPTVLAADGATPSSLVVRIADAYNNPVDSAAVSISASGASNSIAPSVGNTDANGMFTSMISSARAEVKTVTCTSGAATPTAFITFTAASPNGLMSSMTASPNSGVVVGASGSTLEVIVADALGNPVPGQAVTFSGSGTNNTFTPSTGATSASGTLTVTMTSTKAQSENAIASFSGASVTAPVTFIAASPNTTMSSLTASPTSLTANGSATSTLNARIADAYNNPVPSVGVTFTSTGTSNTITPSSGTTNASGLVSSAIQSTHAESKILTATGGSATPTAQVTFTAGPPVASTSYLTASPNNNLIAGTTASNLTVFIGDANGNPVPGQAVTFSGSGTNNTFTPSTGTTSASGTLTVTMTSTKAQSENAIASFSGASVTAPVTFIAASPNTTMSSLTASPTSLTANGSATSTLNARIADAYNNPVPSVGVTFTSTGTSNTITPSSGTTNASGLVSSAIQSTHAESKTLTATGGSATPTAQVTFAAGPPNAAHSSIVINPTTVAADGLTSMTVTVTVADQFSNRVSYTPVSLFDVGAGAHFAQPSGVTTISGILSTTMTSKFFGKNEIFASFSGQMVSASATFTQRTPWCSNANRLSFTTQTTTTPLPPYGAIVADFNNDGNQDIASAQSPNGFVIMLGKGNITFSAPSFYSTAVGVGQLAAADLNLDGFTDLIAPLGNSNTLAVFLGHGDGTLNSALNYSQPGSAYAAALADIDADGYIDAALYGTSAGKFAVFVLLGQGNGTFVTGPITTATYGSKNGVAVDLDRDGRLDLLFADYSNSQVGVFRGSGSGNFAVTTPVATQYGAYPVVAGDLNGDGNQDVLVTSNNNGGPGNLDVYVGNGSVSLPAYINYTAGSAPYTAAVGDFNGDGIQDATTCSYSTGNTQVYLGRGDGTFAATQNYAAGNGPVGSLVGDFNDDGRDDVVCYSYNDNTFTFYIYSSCN